MSSLECELSEEELKSVIFSMSSQKAPGPDGFTGLFYRSTWSIIKYDLLRALQQMFELRASSWHLLNTASIVLIPKKEGQLSPSSFRPISLMHNVAKILSKILANRLAPLLPKLVSLCQSAFIKGRCIQDSYQYVQGVIILCHKKKLPMLFMKLDISRAFDSVRWDFMLELMQRLGFGQRWRDLLCLLWGSTTSKIILNGIPGKPIRHHSGLMQA
jgi:hypothetical protein